MSDKGAYGLRRRDAGFAAAWGEAMQIGFARLEEMLMEHALAAAERLVAEGPGSVVEDGGEDGAEDGAEAADDRPSQPLTADEIKLFMFLLSRHAANLKNPRVIGAKAHHATREETNAVLKRKLDSLDRRMKTVTASSATGSSAT